MVPEQVTLPLAFLAGFVSFVSPCVLPLIPAYVTFLTGSSFDEVSAGAAGERRRLMLNGTFFVLGFSAVFVLMGLGASAIGQFLTGNLPIVRRLGGLVVIAFGLYMMGVLRVFALDRERRVQARMRPPGPANSLLLGMTFAAGWTPCIGPVLASVLVLAGTSSTAGQGALLLLTYAAGLAVPFLLLTVFLSRMRAVLRKLLPHVERIRFASGALLVVLGVMLYTNTFVLLNSWFNWGL